MIHGEVFPTRVAAMRRERYYKAGSGYRRKHELIAGLFEDLFAGYPRRAGWHLA